MIHAVHSNNMSEMGGLRKPMPVTFWTFLIGAAALAGVAAARGVLVQGRAPGGRIRTGTRSFVTLVLVTAVMTAFYMTRWCC